MTDYMHQINAYLSECFENMPVLPDLISGSLGTDDLRQIALLHYAETKTFINLKNPARMYLCPHDAVEAKKYFCFLYREEQGGFVFGKNHADLMKPLCYELGLTDDNLEYCYEKYRRSFFYLFHETPSYEVMIRELGISVAWESLTPYFGERLIAPLREKYNFSEKAMRYFTTHHTVDQAHSKQAVKTLAKYCTDDASFEIAKRGIRSALIDDLHLTQPYTLRAAPKPS